MTNPKEQFVRYVAHSVLQELISTAQVIQADMVEMPFTKEALHTYADNQTECGRFLFNLVLENLSGAIKEMKKEVRDA